MQALHQLRPHGVQPLGPVQGDPGDAGVRGVEFDVGHPRILARPPRGSPATFHVLVLTSGARHDGVTELRSTSGGAPRRSGDPTMLLSDLRVSGGRPARLTAGHAAPVRRRRGRRAEAWGPGGEWLLDRAGGAARRHDDPAALVPRHAAVAEAQRRHPGTAHRPHRRGAAGPSCPRCSRSASRPRGGPLVAGHRRALGEPAPGRSASSCRRRPPTWPVARTGGTTASAWTAGGPRPSASPPPTATGSRRPPPAPSSAYERLAAFPGVGAVDGGHRGRGALGDPDAVVVGDYHLPHLVTYALAGGAGAPTSGCSSCSSPTAASGAGCCGSSP